MDSNIKALGYLWTLLIIFVFISCGDNNPISSNTGTFEVKWKWQNPLPQGNSLNAIHIFNSEKAIAVGHGGTVLRTHDGGFTWNVEHHVGGGSKFLNSVHFINEQIGWIVGWERIIDDKGIVLKTSDGGENWDMEKSLAAIAQRDNNFRDIYFVDEQNGWILGVGGDIYRTRDGGNEWSIQDTNISETLLSMFFINPMRGYVVGTNGTILSTDNSGATWKLQNSNSSEQLNGVFFLNELTGWVVGYGGVILKTDDGGETWSHQNSGSTETLWDVRFMDSLRGSVVGRTVLSTTDGGTTWQQKLTVSANNLLRDVKISPNGYGLAVGDGAIILRTQDAGNSWYFQTSSIFMHFTRLIDFDFVDRQSGWAVGAVFDVDNNVTGGIVSRTTNGGSQWQVLSSLPNVLSAVDFYDQNLGWAIGGGQIIHSSDGGETWQPQTSGTSVALNDVFFVDERTGWVVGDDGTILKTIDGGQTWTPQGTPQITDHLWCVFFLDKNTGFASGQAGGGGFSSAILKTTDGGSTWDIRRSVDGIFHKVQFVTHQVGYLAGDDLFKTVDGGATWKPLVISVRGITSIHFFDEQLGIVSASGKIFGASDGGKNWVDLQNPASSFTTIFELRFLDQNAILLVGDNGTIISGTIN